jgi:hypothetical protein
MKSIALCSLVALAIPAVALATPPGGEAPKVITQTPVSAGTIPGASGSVKFEGDRIHVTMKVPAANVEAKRFEPFVWYPASPQAAVGTGQWKGLTLKPEGQVDGMKIYKGDFKQGEHDFTSATAYRAGVAFGGIISRPAEKPVALWSQPIGRNVTPQLQPTKADYEFLKKSGLTPTFTPKQ